MTLRNNIVHTSGTVDIEVARPFDEAYFCTTVDGSQNPTTCGADIAAALGDETTNQTLSFTGVNTACLYVGSSLMFRGVAVSVVQRRRDGYAFAAAVTGRDGEIVFGEDDDLGHLWLYFPRIEASSYASPDK